MDAADLVVPAGGSHFENIICHRRPYTPSMDRKDSTVCKHVTVNQAREEVRYVPRIFSMPRVLYR